MNTLATGMALGAIATTALIYGIDLLCALVMARCRWRRRWTVQ